MKFRGRSIDPVALWSNYVDLPPNLVVDENTTFLPLVRCPNPEHQTEKRHFQINVTQPFVHCFAECGISGHYEDAIALIEGVGNREARRIIFRKGFTTAHNARRIGSRHKRGSTAVISTDLLQYRRFIPQAGLSYLRTRGVKPSTIAEWELGWDENELRIIIPAKDRRGNVKFLIKRAVKPKDFPKYLYPEGVAKTRLLFGACQIDLGMVSSEGIVLVEGSLDAMLCHQDGLRNTVAILGSRLSEIQAREIANFRPKRVYTMFDRDAAGVQATISAAGFLRGFDIRVCRYPEGCDDPAEMNSKQKRRAIQRAVRVNDFMSQAGLVSRSRSQKEYSVGKSY